MILKPEVARAFVPLLKPARYKGAHGGRGSGKSHFFAEHLIMRCLAKETRAVCIREIQKSLKESVRQLLIDKIAKFGVGDQFNVLDAEIRGPRGSLIIFNGMQSHNAETIKSLEGYDIAWVEEAQTLSALSLRMLRPTIRKAGSELWFSWNPRHATDPVDELFRGAHPPKDCVRVEAQWFDNPWFTTELQDERDRDYQADPEMAEHVWGGGYQIITEGAYYARLIAQAEKDGRVGHFPHDPALPVFTSWDIGVDDYTSIWFWQDAGAGPTFLDYYEVSGDGAEQIVKTALPELNPNAAERATALSELGREPFTYAKHFLPHDVKNREWGSGARSRFETLMGFGVKPIHVGAAVGPEERINASRALLPHARFDANRRVMLGLSRLRRYRRKFNDTLGTYTTPEHDISSHGADAFGEAAVNSKVIVQALKPEKPPKHNVIYADEAGRIKSTQTIRQMIDGLSKKRAKR